MLSIGQFAEISRVSTRTLRHYEVLGLLPPSHRGDNNYRYYDQKLLPRMARIRELQELGFSLEEIKALLPYSNQELKERLQSRLNDLDVEIQNLRISRDKIQNLLSVSDKIETGDAITATERTFYMETIREEILNNLRSKNIQWSEQYWSYLRRDPLFQEDSRMTGFLKGVHRCLEFAQKNNLRIGPVRGSASSSLSLYGLGASTIHPMVYGLIPERLHVQQPILHLDVEFERGQEFVDFCREINKTLSYGEIQAFKMPLIDIVKDVQKRVHKIIPFAAIDEDSDTVLQHFRNGDIEKIFSFDFSKKALVMKYENFLPDYEGIEKMQDYLSRQNIQTFRDVINITALWRPHHQEMLKRIELYAAASNQIHVHKALSVEMRQTLRSNRGMIIYHEDLMRIISHYSGWDYSRSNFLRRALWQYSRGEGALPADWTLLNEIAPSAVCELVKNESPWAFCMPHAISFGQFTKQTAILKSLHRQDYYAAIEEFEQKHGFAWDDIGIRIKGVSLLQD